MITIIKSDVPLAKTYTGTPEGVVKGKSARVSEGIATLVDVRTAPELVELLHRVCAATDEAICAGAFTGAKVGDPIRLVAESTLIAQLKVPRPEGRVHLIAGRPTVARLKRGTEPTEWLLLDADNPPGIPDAWAKMSIAERLALWEPMIPGISRCERVELRGSSARVGSGHVATHAWIRVSNPELVAALKSYVGVAMVNRNLSFNFHKHSTIDPSRVVGIEARSVFDLAVWDTGRLVFCSRPILIDMGATEVADPDIRIVNEGGGVLDISWVRLPSPRDMELYRGHTGVKLNVGDGGLSTTSIGQLRWDTEIESRGQVRTLRDWVDDMSPGDKMRCESPFRESHSEAALLRLTEGGRPCVHDVGNGVTYYLPVVGHPIFEQLAFEVGMTPEEFMTEADANVERLERVVTAVAYSLSQSRFFVSVNGTDGYKECVQADFATFVDDLYGKVCNMRPFVDPKATAAEAKSLLFRPYKLMIDRVKIDNQFESLEVQVDMFTENSSVEIRDKRAKFTLPHIEFDEGVIDYAIVDDYKVHFPQFDELLVFAAAARFSHNRKRTYLWMQCDSDWGKGFFMDIWGGLRVLVKTSVKELEKADSGSPSGLTIQDFRRAWVLAVDEFKGVTAEVKKLQNDFRFSPKNQPAVTVQLYLKLFLSAENVHSLASEHGGVEDQFANRFCHFKAHGTLDSRKMFKEAGTETYRQSLINYTAKKLNEAVDEYKKLGLLQASKLAEERIDEFYDKYRIDRGFERLSDQLESIANDFCQWVKSCYSINDRRVSDSVIYTDDVIYIKSTDRVLKMWAEDSFDPGEIGKIKYKTGQIKELLGGVHQRWLQMPGMKNKINVRVLRIGEYEMENPN